MALKEIWIPSPHYSSSRGPYNKAVLHTTEGAMKIRDLGSWFQNPSAGCSSHHGADNYERGTFGAYVYENHKAWTQGNANDYCLSLEQCAYASWSRDTWLNSKETLLRNTADWLAYVCGKYGIPLRALSNSEAQNASVKGVCQHVQLGSWGSGHSDCGGGFPLDKVLEWAKGSPGGSAPAPEEGAFMPASAYFHETLHMAMINENGTVCYDVEGGGDFYAVDPNQSGAKGGCDITISDGGRICITYINGSNKVCTYTRAPGGGPWMWADRGGKARG